MAGESISTSRHTLSADAGLTKVQRIAWMLYNLRNNARPSSGVDDRIQHRGFRTTEKALDGIWDQTDDRASPARRLCDAFWHSLPWSTLISELQEAKAIEFGCGSGIYGTLLSRLLGENFGSYRGVDIDQHVDWSSFDDDRRFEFRVGRAGDADTMLKDTNLILTQSALEHFKEDLLFFRHLADFVAENDTAVLQFHLIPSAPCILTFPWHGVREYTPRTISRITRLFDDRTRFYLFDLGGRRCNALHRSSITWPRYRHGIDRRYEDTTSYTAALRKAILEDFADPGAPPAFYALVLTSGFKQDPLKGWPA